MMNMAMMNEDDYVLQIHEIEQELQQLEAQRQEITVRMSILTTNKEDLKRQYNLAKLKNKVNSGKWTKGKFQWTGQLLKVLKDKFNFDGFKGKQLAAINATMAGEDVLVVMPTGSGKSLVYQLPALVTGGLTLVISPLISLISDQIRSLKDKNITAATINANTAREVRNTIHKHMLSEGSSLNILYVTPEWIAKSKGFMANLQKTYEKGLLKRIVIDEVHCCSQWGHDFRTDYNHLSLFKTMFPNVPLLGLTATATLNVLIDIQRMLDLTNPVIITSPFNRPNLYYEVMVKPWERESAIEILVLLMTRKYKNQSGIIYIGTVKEAEDITGSLRQRGVRVHHYHAQMEYDKREAVYQKWLKGDYQAVVATVAFGMGIDKPNVRFIIHYSVPKSMESLYQESGRAGRDGQKADCIIMYSLGDFLRNVSMVNSKTEERNAMSVLDYCLSQKRCRRELISTHFGDHLTKADCKLMCDHCRHSKPVIEYNISDVYKDIKNIIISAGAEGTKLTLHKLLQSWYGSGPKTLRVPTVSIPICQKEQAEHIIGFLIQKKYLIVEKGYTMYTTVPYIQKAENVKDVQIIMPYTGRLIYPKLRLTATVNIGPNAEPQPSCSRYPPPESVSQHHPSTQPESLTSSESKNQSTDSEASEIQHIPTTSGSISKPRITIHESVVLTNNQLSVSESTDVSESTGISQTSSTSILTDSESHDIKDEIPEDSESKNQTTDSEIIEVDSKPSTSKRRNRSTDSRSSSRDPKKPKRSRSKSKHKHRHRRSESETISLTDSESSKSSSQRRKSSDAKYTSTESREEDVQLPRKLETVSDTNSEESQSEFKILNELKMKKEDE